MNGFITKPNGNNVLKGESRARFGCENMRLVRLPGRGHVEFVMKQVKSSMLSLRPYVLFLLLRTVNASRGVLFLSFKHKVEGLEFFNVVTSFFFPLFFLFYIFFPSEFFLKKNDRSADLAAIV